MGSTLVPPSWFRRRARLLAIVLLAMATATVAVVAIDRADDETATTAGPATTATTDGSTSTSAPTTTSAPADPTTTATIPPTSAPPTTTSPPASPSVVLRRVATAQPVVLLTFDAGSDAGATTRILDLLRARGMTASFGLTGDWVEAYPSLARRIVVEGHSVINHTQDHRSFTGFSTDSAPLSTAEREEQVRLAEERIRSVAGADPRPWFRPPYGDIDDGVLVDVGRLGYRYTVMWSLDSLGWKALPAAEVAARVIAALEPGAIILMHVGSASTDVDALPAILDAVRARGLRAVGLAQLGLP